jgi:hypothetical protein
MPKKTKKDEPDKGTEKNIDEQLKELDEQEKQKEKPKDKPLEPTIGDRQGVKDIVDDIKFRDNYSAGEVDIEDIDFADIEPRLSGDVMTVNPFIWEDKVRKDQRASKYLTIATEFLMVNDTLKVRGRGRVGPGFAIEVAKAIRIHMSNMGKKTSWDDPPRIFVQKRPVIDKRKKPVEKDGKKYFPVKKDRNGKPLYRQTTGLEVTIRIL